MNAIEAIKSGQAEQIWKPSLKAGSLFDDKPFELHQDLRNSKNQLPNHVTSLKGDLLRARTQTELLKKRRDDKVSIYQLQFDSY